MSIQAFYERLQIELVAWAERVAEIRAILVVGSQARQIKPADEYSDLDISLYVTRNHAQETEFYLQWMRNFAPVWMILEEHHDETKSWLILYQGGIKVDFSVTPISMLQPLIDDQYLWDDQQRGYNILLDKDGIVAQLPTPTPFAPPPYTPPTQAQFIQRVEGYSYGAVYIAKQIKRGNLWKAKWADQIQQRMLLEMLEWHAHATHDSPVDTYYRGDFMRDWVSEATWRELHDVFAHFEAADSRKSLIASVRLFTRLTEETAAKLGYDYPQRVITEATDYILVLGDV
ncbi:MAG: aminoglycoside 6-adenylyltransferase [Chloroflexi bacterium OLB15]|nr:MAG: aminoglycoside 6-adenylyltransferase [Chloroflexi bacterium OLB15]